MNLRARQSSASRAAKLCLTQPRSQGLSSSRPRERERGDPGWGWSRVSQNLGLIFLLTLELISAGKDESDFSAKCKQPFDLTVQ